MKLFHSFTALLISVSSMQASTLDVYQDKTFYTYTPKSNFVGFTQGILATCDGSPMALVGMSKCPNEERLCKVLTRLKDSEQHLQDSVENSKVLEKLISLPEPTSFDADLAIASAKRIGEEQSRLLTQKKLLADEVNLQKRLFLKQAPTKEALQSSELCIEQMELSIPYGMVSFSTRYEADLKTENEVLITQYLSVTNRSGIDIEADKAMFYYRRADQPVNIIHFSPWIVSKSLPQLKREVHLAKAYRSEAMQMDSAMVPALETAPVATYEDAREYQIKNLTLPSTGVPLDFPVLQWRTALSCDIRTYPYRRAQAFHLCSFKPKYQIERNIWKVKSSSEVINENAFGEYRDEKYQIYTKVEEDIKIVRKTMVQKERETGIFGGTARKKDGFSLILTNKSKKAKTVTIIERIPTSTTEEIKVKLVEIKSTKKINYSVLKEGKIEMKIALSENETRKIDVVFEISYDKDLKVKY